MQPDYLDIALKLAAAWAAGSMIGLERTFRGRPAGFRTHALVCVASALLMQVTAYQWQWIGDVSMETIRTDPTRMAQGIMTGIGFLGGGVIFKEGLTVRGLTTAASVWTTAALGILFGVGLYFPAVLGTVLTLGILAVFRRLENLIPSQIYAHYSVRYRADDAPTGSDVSRMLKESGFRPADLSYATAKQGTILEYRTVIQSAKKANVERLVERLRNTPEVIGFNISPTGD